MKRIVFHFDLLNSRKMLLGLSLKSFPIDDITLIDQKTQEETKASMLLEISLGFFFFETSVRMVR